MHRISDTDLAARLNLHVRDIRDHCVILRNQGFLRSEEVRAQTGPEEHSAALSNALAMAGVVASASASSSSAAGGYGSGYGGSHYRPGTNFSAFSIHCLVFVSLQSLKYQDCPSLSLYLFAPRTLGSQWHTSTGTGSTPCTSPRYSNTDTSECSRCSRSAASKRSMSFTAAAPPRSSSARQCMSKTSAWGRSVACRRIPPHF